MRTLVAMGWFTDSEGTVLTLRYLYSDFKDYGNKWTYTLNDGSSPGYKVSQRAPDYSIGNVALSGSHTLTSMVIHWEAAVSRSAEVASAGNPGADFKPTGDLSNSTNCLYDASATTNIYLPQWTSNCFTPGPDYIFNTDDYKLKSVTYSHGLTAQLNLLAAGSVAKNYHLGSHFATFEFGGKFRNAHKFDDSWEDEFDPNSKYLMTQFLGNFTNPNFYGGHYPFGPVTDWANITGFVNANGSDFAYSNTYGGNNNNFDMVEQISAGYLMNTVDLGRFRVIAGVRFEGTSVKTLSCDCTNPVTGQGPVNVPFNGSYFNALPSASVRYRIDDNSDLRVVYGMGLARPDPEFLTTAVTIDITTNPYTYSIGNPALKAEHAQDGDILYERYLKPIGMVSGGIFYKYLTNPIIEATTH
ncbi:MAG TPA: TonB-dependent receptor, partial [Terriglobia bacterium]|nr:TonB-dependent receptor [Terriglobia bacterium]